MPSPQDIAAYISEHTNQLRVHFMDPRAIEDASHWEISGEEYGALVESVLAMNAEEIEASLREYNELDTQNVTPQIEQKQQLILSVPRFILGVNQLPV